MSVKDYKDLLQPLLKGESQKDFKKFKQEIIRLIKKVFKKSFSPEVEALFKKHYKKDYLEELFQDVMLKLIYNRNTLLNLPFISEAYLFSTVQKVIYSHLSKSFKISRKQTYFEDIKECFKKELNDSKENLKAEEILANESFDYLKHLKIEEWFNELAQILNEKEKETLCYYLYKYFYKKKIVFKNLSKSALYKRWERLKEKLRTKFAKNLDTGETEIFKEVMEKFFSEVCQKLEEKRVNLK